MDIEDQRFDPSNLNNPQKKLPLGGLKKLKKGKSVKKIGLYSSSAAPTPYAECKEDYKKIIE